METEERCNRFCGSIDNIAKKITRYKNVCAERYGLSSRHVVPLLQLYACPEGLTAANLAEQCQVDKSFVSRVTKELTEAGFLHYQGRNQNIVLTEKGKQTASALMEYANGAVLKVDGAASPGELEVFYRMLNRVDLNLGELVNEGKRENG